MLRAICHFFFKKKDALNPRDFKLGINPFGNGRENQKKNKKKKKMFIRLLRRECEAPVGLVTSRDPLRLYR